MTPTQALRALIFTDRAALDALAGHCCSTHLDDAAVRACERCGLLVDAVLTALEAPAATFPIRDLSQSEQVALGQAMRENIVEAPAASVVRIDPLLNAQIASTMQQPAASEPPAASALKAYGRQCYDAGAKAERASLVAELVALPVHWAVPIERPGGPSVQYLERRAVLRALQET